MRMWMLNPVLLCRRHLLGEHGELHKFLPCWRKRQGIANRIAGNAIEPGNYQARHDVLAAEMLRRGYRHETPCEQPDFGYLPESQRNAVVNIEASLAELTRRCPECRERICVEVTE
jgi:hypothetical protein